VSDTSTEKVEKCRIQLPLADSAFARPFALSSDSRLPSA